MNATEFNILYDHFLKSINKLPISFKNETVDFCSGLIEVKKTILDLIADRILTDKELFNIVFVYLDFLCNINLTQRLIDKTINYIDEWIDKIKAFSLENEYYETVQNIINWYRIRNYDFFRPNI